MATHVFLVECAADLQAADSGLIPYELGTYLQDHARKGSAHDFVKATTRAEAVSAIQCFENWVARRASCGDWVILWLSMHGEKPGDGSKVGTNGEIVVDGATGRKKTRIRWLGLLRKCKWPKNTVVLMDVCWGGSPTFSRCASKSRNRPVFVFGPAREAARLELDAAAALVIGWMGWKGTLDRRRAKRTVDVLNATFAPKGMTPFYRVWWYDKAPHLQQYPANVGHRVRRLPSA